MIVKKWLIRLNTPWLCHCIDLRYWKWLSRGGNILEWTLIRLIALEFHFWAWTLCAQLKGFHHMESWPTYSTNSSLKNSMNDQHDENPLKMFWHERTMQVSIKTLLKSGEYIWEYLQNVLPSNREELPTAQGVTLSNKLAHAYDHMHAWRGYNIIQNEWVAVEYHNEIDVKE